MYKIKSMYSVKERGFGSSLGFFCGFSSSGFGFKPNPWHLPCLPYPSFNQCL